MWLSVEWWVIYLFMYSVRLGLLLVHSRLLILLYLYNISILEVDASRKSLTVVLQCYFPSPLRNDLIPCKEMNDTNKESSEVLYGRSYKCYSDVNDCFLCGCCCLTQAAHNKDYNITLIYITSVHWYKNNTPHPLLLFHQSIPHILILSIFIPIFYQHLPLNLILSDMIVLKALPKLPKSWLKVHDSFTDLPFVNMLQFTGDNSS